MAQGPVKKLRSERNRIEQYGREGTLPRQTTDALLEWASALHPNENEHTFVWPDGEPGEFAIGSVETYLREMRKVAERAIPDLLDATPGAFNNAIDQMQAGENPNVQEGGLSKTTLGVTQAAARTFFWYFDIAHPNEIETYGVPSEPIHDEGDLLNSKDIRALREHVEGLRNRALLEMLLNTGQRITAIQSLRIMDIDIEQGWFSLNTEYEGLKGAADRLRERPLLGAAPYLANWLNAHPLSEDLTAYVFIGDLNHHYTTPDAPLCQGAIRNMLETTAARAGVDKPVNPHNFRHCWTTMMKQDYGLNDEEVKLLLGHKREGNGANRVYNHSTAERLRESTERKLSPKGQSAAKPLTPDRCGECEESLDSNWICCPVCGVRYGP